MLVLTLGEDGRLHEFDAFSLINLVLLSVEGYLWMDSGMPLMQIWVRSRYSAGEGLDAEQLAGGELGVGVLVEEFAEEECGDAAEV